MKILSKNEIKILSYLENNSKTSFSNIGKKTKLSQQRVSYTINSFKKRNILTKFYPIIDYSKLNVILFRVYFRVSYTKEYTFENLIKHLVENNKTSWVEECGGKYDLIVTFFSFNPSQFNKEINEIIETFPRQLQNYCVLTTIVERRFCKKFLNNNISYDELIIGGDKAPIEIDKDELLLLNILSKDSRISSVELGKLLNFTPKTILSKIKSLEKKKIILGYKPLLDLRNAGNKIFLFLLKYHNITTSMESKLISYLRAHVNIIKVIKTIGEWNIEIKIEINESSSIRKTERDIRENFGQLIKETLTIPIYATHKVTYFPQFLIE